MRPVSDLVKLRSSINFRLLRLRRIYNIARSYPSVNEKGALLSFVVIELDDLVVSSMRVFVISCFWSARTVMGHRITTACLFWSEAEIAAYVMSVLRPTSFDKRDCPYVVNRSDEITIRDPRDIEKILLSCSSSNLIAWQSALSLNSSLFSYLAIIRNFYAHRNKDTLMKVIKVSRALGLFGVRHADDLLTAIVPGRPISIFEDWLDDAEIFFDVCTA